MKSLTPIWTPQVGPQSDAYHSPADWLYFGGAAGGGKACYTGSMIPTPDGWTTMAELVVGDEVLDESGRPCRVLVKSEVFEDHDCFEVVFDDGETVIADAEHRWWTFTDAERSALARRSPEFRERRRASRPKRGTNVDSALAARNSLRASIHVSDPVPGGIRTTREIAATVRVQGGKRINHSVPLAAPLVLPEVELPIPPYTLGAWLGDGNSRAGRMTTPDYDIGVIKRIEEDGFTVRKVPSEKYGWSILGLKVDLRKAGLLQNKHIPAIYLRASHTQRLELLRGLMDTDGCCGVDGGAEFTSVTEQLAKDVQELARTLGLKSTLTVGRSKLNGRDYGPNYRVKLTTNLRIFHLPHKADRQREKVRSTQTQRYIVDCRSVETVPVQCIAVDSPNHLYLVGKGFVPTHNTDLSLGLALTQHRRSIFLRQYYDDLDAAIERLMEIVGDYGTLNRTTRVWRSPDNKRVIKFAAINDPRDKGKFQGRPYDLYIWDEVATQIEDVVRFVSAWNRTTIPGQRCRILLPGNPPMTAEGEWLLRFFGPWLDPKHPRPANPGELRWYAMVDGVEVERPDGEPFQHSGETIRPKSRTFIPSLLRDNAYLRDTGYADTIDALPEPLRSWLRGNFHAGRGSDPWQAIPTDWVDQAIERGRKQTFPPQGWHMTSLGVDVARGGADRTVLAPRYGNWYGPLEAYPGKETPRGEDTATLVVNALREDAVANVDVIGYGSSAYDVLIGQGVNANPINVGAGSQATDKSGRLKFRNLRAEIIWKFREALDPQSGENICLPDDSELKADLCAPKWKITHSGIQIESKDDVKGRIGRSPDRGDALLLAFAIGSAKFDGLEDSSEVSESGWQNTIMPTSAQW